MITMASTARLIGSNSFYRAIAHIMQRGMYESSIVANDASLPPETEDIQASVTEFATNNFSNIENNLSRIGSELDIKLAAILPHQMDAEDRLKEIKQEWYTIMTRYQHIVLGMQFGATIGSDQLVSYETEQFHALMPMVNRLVMKFNNLG